MYAAIKGIVFHDAGHTGSYSPHHTGLAGVVLVLESPDHHFSTTTTHSNGHFCFSDIATAGKYILYETVLEPKDSDGIPTQFPHPFGYNGSTTPRYYTILISNEHIHNEIVFDSYYFGHDFLEPFDATSLAYQVNTDSTKLYTLNLITGTTTLLTTLTPSGNYHHLSFNPIDQYLYGYDATTHQVFRMSPSGVVTYYTVAHLPHKNYVATAINHLGQLYLYEPLDIDFYIVDLASQSPSYMQLILPDKKRLEKTDEHSLPIVALAIETWAFHPKTHQLYTINHDGCMIQINPLDGSYELIVTTGTPLALVSTILFDYAGDLYCIFENIHSIYHITLDHGQAIAELFTPLDHIPWKGGARCSDVPLYISFGSAPDLSSTNGPGNYHTTLSNNGPRHAITNILMLGDTDNHSFVCDMPPLLLTDSTYTLTLPALNRTGKDAYLYGWLDLNQNGIFEGIEAADPIVIPSRIDAPYEALLTFVIPKGYPIVVGKTYCRLRITTDYLINTQTDSKLLDTRSLGPASDGEVSDFKLNITGLPPRGTDQIYEICYTNQNISRSCHMVDPSGGSLKFSLVRSPASGNVTIDSTNGKWEYVPSLDYVGEDAFIIRCTSSISSLYTDIHVVVYTLLVDVALEFEANLSEATSEDMITYTTSLKNIGTIPIDHVTLTNLLPFGCYFIPGSVVINNVHAPSLDITVSVPIDPLAPSEEFSLSFQCSPSNDLQTIEASCKVSYSYMPKPDTPACSATKSSPTLKTSVKSPQLEVRLESDLSNVLVGDLIQFTVTLSNTGNMPLQNMRLYPRLASQLSYMNNLLVNDQPVYANLLSGYAIETLHPQSITTLQFTTKASEVATNTTLESLLKVDYDYLLAGRTHSKSIKSSLHTLKVHVPKLEFIKAPNKTSVSLGELFTYTFTMHNHSDLIAEQIVIQDTLPSVFEVLEITCEKELLTNTLHSGIQIGKLLPHTSKSMVVHLKAIGRLTENVASPAQGAIGSFSFKLPDNKQNRELKVEAVIPNEIFVTDAALNLHCSLSTYQASIGESITYTLHLTNTGTVTLNEVLIQDLLSPELKFVAHSVRIDGTPQEHASIISGITLSHIAVNTSMTLTFDVIVIAKVSKQLDCSLSAYYTYGFNASKPMKTGHTTSNPCILILHYVAIELSGSIAQPIAFLNDEIYYTLRIQNAGDTPVFNMLLRNESASYELVDSSFKMNDKLINSVDLTKGINLGALSPNNTLLITYTQKISEHYYPLDNLTSTLSTHFSYTTHDHSIKYGDSNILSLVIPLALSTFKQFDLENYFELSDYKPDLESINLISGHINLLKHYIIKTPTGTSSDDQKLTSHNLILHGALELTAEYVSNETTHSIYSSYHTMPFSTFIVLPEDFPVHSHIRINPTLESISFKLINNRSFFASASILAVAYIK